MKKPSYAWIIVALVLLLVGAVLFVVAMSLNHWDFSSFGTQKLTTRTVDVRGDFRNIIIQCDTEDIDFVPSTDGTCKVVFKEYEKVTHTAEVQNQVLLIESKDLRSWYDYISFFSNGSPSITVYLPKLEYQSLLIKESTGDVLLPKDFSFESIDITVSTGDIDCSASASGALKIETDTGDIQLKDASAEEITLSVHTGKVEVASVVCQGDVTLTVTTGKATLSDLSCQNLRSTGDTGKLVMKNVIAAGSVFIVRSTGDVSLEMCDAAEFSIETSTGDVDLEQCDAAEFSIKTDTGDVTGSLLTEKIFVTKTNTGRIEVPLSTTGGTCQITTNTGNIKIEIR